MHSGHTNSSKVIVTIVTKLAHIVLYILIDSIILADFVLTVKSLL